MDKQLRKIEVFKNGQWNAILMQDVKMGDVIRMFEPDGERVIGSGHIDGAINFLATTDAFLQDYEGIQVWSIKSTNADTV
jgi:hypothetical protein